MCSLESLAWDKEGAELSTTLHNPWGTLGILGGLQEGSQSLGRGEQEGGLPSTPSSHEERIGWDGHW